MLAGKRAIRLGDDILKEIAVLLLEKVRDPRVHGVTLTGIQLSSDLRTAKVYYSVMGGEGQVVTAQKGLDSAKGFIKKQIGLRMMLRYVPEITFLHDMSLQKGSRLEKLLDELTVSDSGDGTE